jgi:nicotinate dehydrogenase subunit A
MARRLTITVNGKRHAVEATPDTPLLYVLRNELGLHGPRFGCGLSQCGACTVHVDGQAARSCIVEVSSVAGKKVTTLEGLGTEKSPHPMLEAFIAEQAAQCGYCINGMVMQSLSYLKHNPSPTRDQVKRALNGNICRCGTHYRILKAVERGSKAMAKGA